MAIQVKEQFFSRNQQFAADSNSVEFEYAIIGAASDEQAHAAFLSGLTATYTTATGGLLFLRQTNCERISQDGWIGRATYGDLEKRETGDEVFSFDTGGGTVHITQSLSTTSYAPVGATAPDFKGAIGVTDDGVEGVDIVVPKYAWTEKVKLQATAITAQYRTTLLSLTGRVNDATFKGFAEGEVLFLGASGSQTSHSDWDITFSFEAAPNAANLTVGDITAITKYGWQYLWVRHSQQSDTTAKRLTRRPIAAYVETVYNTGNFALLGIGV